MLVGAIHKLPLLKKAGSAFKSMDVCCSLEIPSHLDDWLSAIRSFRRKPDQRDFPFHFLSFFGKIFPMASFELFDVAVVSIIFREGKP